MTNHLPDSACSGNGCPDGGSASGSRTQPPGLPAMPPLTRLSLTGFFGLWLAVLLLVLDVEAAPAAVSPPPSAMSAKSSLKPQRVKTFQQLRRLLKGKHPAMAAGPGGAELMLPPVADAGGKAAAAGSVNPYSATNVQVEGVDEGDIAKTDGQYLYTLQDGQLRIIRAYPAATLSLLASVKFEEGFHPVELYVEGTRLVVIGNLWKSDSTDTTASPPQETASLAKISLLPVGENSTVARVFDISDKQHPVQEREVAFTGQYVASRKIADAVYLVGRTYPLFYTFAATDGASRFATLTRNAALPKVSDTALKGGKPQPLPLNKLSYFPNFVDPNYVVVAGFRLAQPAHPADIKSYLGAGDIAYASLDRLYLSAADYGADAVNPVTHVYSFAIGRGAIRFRHAGGVPGTVLNQFSMDEHQGYFRIATTVRQWKQTEEAFETELWNNVYILDDSMRMVGKLEHLAEGESLYAARFMGERAYLVTYRQTDPLFTIDLADPATPKVLGELILPGFSTYLHPYDSEHLLGIGRETTVTGDRVLDGGVKLALFDVADVSQPRLLHSEVIGTEGTYSDAMYDHKALWFDRDRHLLGFPIADTSSPGGDAWPTASFQGAYVYDVTPEGGFTRKAAITQMPEDGSHAWNRYIRRLLAIGDQLYTVSDGRVQANRLSDFAQTGAVDLAVVPETDPMPIDGGSADPDGGVMCTLDAKLCPDGKTWVGRSGPACEFAPCPAAE